MTGSGTDSAMNSAMEKMFEKGFAKLDEADRRSQRNGGEEKTTKLAGIFEVPEMVGTVVEGLWNEGVDDFTKWLHPRAHPTFEKWGAKAGLKGSALAQGATIATVALNTTLKSGIFIHPVYEAFRDKHEQKVQMARKMAPVLDIEGGHSVHTLMHSKNDMIRAHAERMTAKSNLKIKNALVKMFINVAPSTVFDLPDYRKMWNGQPVTGEITAGEARVKNFVGRIARVGSAPMANVLTHSNERAYKKKFGSEYSALEMVLELNDQVAEKPDASGFTMPGKNRRAMGLEDYVREIITQHQKDMADISTEHTEIRDALKDDVKSAAAVLAEAIRQGDISALSLIELIGGGEVIKRNGRAIADSDEIKEHIAQLSGKHSVHAVTDVKEYLKDSDFTIEDLEKSLKLLEGTPERVHFASMFPNELLKKAGMGASEIKEMRAETLEHYGREICATFLGLNALPDEELKAGGLATHEIKSIREMSKHIERSGESAVAKLKNNPGANHAVPNWLVSHATEYGTLRSEGMQLLEKAELKHKTANDNDTIANDNEHGHHSRREQDRRAHGGHGEREV